MRDEEAARDNKPVSRITLVEVLIAVAIIVALILWLPSNWNKRAGEVVPVVIEWNTPGVPEGNFIFTTDDQLLCPVGRELFRVDLSNPPVKLIYSHTELIKFVAASPDGRRIVLSSHNGLTELVVDGTTLKTMGTIQLTKPLLDVAIDNEGQLLICIQSLNGTLSRRSKHGAELTELYSLATANGLTRDAQVVIAPSCATIDATRQRVAIAYPGGVVCLSGDGRQKSNTQLAGSPAESIQLLADKDRWIIARDGQVSIYAAGKLDKVIALGNVSIPAIANLSGNGQAAILTNLGNTRLSSLKIFNLSSDKQPVSFELATHSGGRWIVASADGKQVAGMTGHGNTTVLKVWKLTGQSK